MISSIQTTILPIAIDGLKCATISATQNLEKIDLVYNSIHTFCLEKAKRNSDFFRKFEVFRPTFNVVETLGMCIASGAAWYQLACRLYTIEQIGSALLFADFVFLGGIGAAIAHVAVSSAISKITRTILLKTTHQLSGELSEANEAARNIQEANLTASGFTAIWPEEETFKHFLDTARITANIALFYLTPTNPFFAINAAVEFYNLSSILSRKWIQYSVELPRDVRDQGRCFINRVRATQTFLQKKIFSRISEKHRACPTCGEDITSKNSSYLCDKHLFHLRCIASKIMSSTHAIAEYVQFPRRAQIVTRHYNEHFIHTHDTTEISYTASVAPESQLACQLCEALPSKRLAQLKIEAHDLPSNQWVCSQIVN